MPPAPALWSRAAVEPCDSAGTALTPAARWSANGTLVLTTGGGAGTVRGALTIGPGASVSCTVGDALGYSAGQCATPVNIIGGTLDNASGINQGYITTFNLMGGLMTNSVATDGTHGFNFNGSSSGLNSLATNIVSIVSGNVVLRSGGLHIDTALGTVPNRIDMTIFPESSAAVAMASKRTGRAHWNLWATTPTPARPRWPVARSS